VRSRTGTPSGPAYRLGGLTPPSGVAGVLREATVDDRPLVVRWVNEFSAEAVPDQPASDPGPQIDARLAYGGLLWFWQVDGEPVSFLWLSAPAAGTVRISAVYTPPDHRGMGYAGACVAAVAAVSYERGATGVMLYADRANATSNGLYLRLGFEAFAEGRTLLFSPH
jgi:GNAT superfamily N-acetyltransferase